MSQGIQEEMAPLDNLDLQGSKDPGARMVIQGSKVNKGQWVTQATGGSQVRGFNSFHLYDNSSNKSFEIALFCLKTQ